MERLGKIIFLSVFVNVCLFGCSWAMASSRENDSILTGQGRLYWDCIDRNLGMCLIKNGNELIEYYRPERYIDLYSPVYDHLTVDKIFTCMNDSLLFYAIRQRDDSCYKTLYRSFAVRWSADKDTLCLIDARGQTDKFVKSPDQSTVPVVRPEERRGFKWPEIPLYDQQVRALIDSSVTVAKQQCIARPDTFQVTFCFSVGKHGEVINAEFLGKAPSLDCYAEFYDALLACLKRLHCLPARIEGTDETFEWKGKFHTKITFNK